MNALFSFLITRKNIFLVLLVWCFFSCKTKTASGSASKPTDEQVYAFAQSKYPEISQSEFQEGKSILNNQCKSCHGIKQIQSRSELEWQQILSEMVPKAKLNASQKNNLTRYLLSYREALLMSP